MTKSATAQATNVATGVGSKVTGTWDRIKSFYTDIRTEMKKVTTPSRKEVQSTTVVVIITVFLFGAYFGVVDFLIGHGIDQLLRHFSGK